MARLIVKRKSQWLNRLRSIGLYLDNQKIGAIANGAMEEFRVEPGQHTLSAKIDWCGSNKHTFTIADNETYTVAVEPYKYANILLVIELAILVIHLIARSVYRIDYIIWLIIPFFLVSIYYVTLGYNRYLVVREDKLSFSF